MNLYMRSNGKPRRVYRVNLVAAIVMIVMTPKAILSGDLWLAPLLAFAAFANFMAAANGYRHQIDE